MTTTFTIAHDGTASVDAIPSHGPLRDLHERTWARGVSPTADELRETYLAIGFPADQLERALARKARWRSLPEVAFVRFARPIGGKTDAKISVE
jgi:hypothetical protein